METADDASANLIPSPKQAFREKGAKSNEELKDSAVDVPVRECDDLVKDHKQALDTLTDFMNPIFANHSVTSSRFTFASFKEGPLQTSKDLISEALLHEMSYATAFQGVQLLEAHQLHARDCNCRNRGYLSSFPI